MPIRQTFIIQYLVYYNNLGPSYLVVLDDNEQPKEFPTRDHAQRWLVANVDDLLPNTHHIVTQTFKTDAA